MERPIQILPAHIETVLGCYSKRPAERVQTAHGNSCFSQPHGPGFRGCAPPSASSCTQTCHAEVVEGWNYKTPFNSKANAPQFRPPGSIKRKSTGGPGLNRRLASSIWAKPMQKRFLSSLTVLSPMRTTVLGTGRPRSYTKRTTLPQIIISGVS